MRDAIRRQQEGNFHHRHIGGNDNANAPTAQRLIAGVSISRHNRIIPIPIP